MADLENATWMARHNTPVHPLASLSNAAPFVTSEDAEVLLSPADKTFLATRLGSLCPVD